MDTLLDMYSSQPTYVSGLDWSVVSQQQYSSAVDLPTAAAVLGLARPLGGLLMGEVRTERTQPLTPPRISERGRLQVAGHVGGVGGRSDFHGFGGLFFYRNSSSPENKTVRTTERGHGPAVAARGGGRELILPTHTYLAPLIASDVLAWPLAHTGCRLPSPGSSSPILAGKAPRDTALRTLEMKGQKKRYTSPFVMVVTYVCSRAFPQQGLPL